jgi:hypothetical protein
MALDKMKKDTYSILDSDHHAVVSLSYIILVRDISS